MPLYKGGEGRGREWRGGMRRGGVGEGFLRRSKRRRHLPKIRTFKKFGQFFFKRPTDNHCGS